MSDSPAAAHRHPRQIACVLIVALVAALAVFAASLVGDRRSGDRFDLVRWERNTLAGKLLYTLGAPLRHDPAPDEAIARFFRASAGSPERAQLESAVEASLEGRIDAVARSRGLFGALPIPGSVFPPVNIELTQPPRVLVQSPRAKIQRTSTTLLRPDLTAADALAIERRTEDDHADQSALVVGAGGVATYPAIVVDRSSYVDTVATAAHEWTHHYLLFYPLGYHYFTSRDATVINETVADIVGDEIGAEVVARWGDPTQPRAVSTPASAPSPPAVAPSSRVDLNAVLRDLRREVDGMLAAGQISQAEARMEAVRVQLANAGFRIRRINQAYFSWYGSYAARPDAVDPLGAQLREIRERSGSLVAFMQIVRQTSSRADVGAALDRLRANG